MQEIYVCMYLSEKPFIEYTCRLQDVPVHTFLMSETSNDVLNCNNNVCLFYVLGKNCKFGGTGETGG